MLLSRVLCFLTLDRARGRHVSGRFTNLQRCGWISSVLWAVPLVSGRSHSHDAWPLLLGTGWGCRRVVECHGIPKSYSILRDPKLVLNLFTCHSLPFTLCCICCASSPQAARKVFDQLETDDRLPTLSCIVWNCLARLCATCCTN